MANDFSSDGNCKALWNFESGALTTDSKGSNTLTNSGVDEDTTNYKQGSCSGLWVAANNDSMTIADTDLDSGFPLKSGETNKSFTFAFWIKFTDASDYQYLIHKHGGYGDKGLVIYIYSSKMRLSISSDGINSNVYEHATALEDDIWYHVGITYNAGDDGYCIRIWDDTAGAIVGTDKTGTSTDININSDNFTLSKTSLETNANIDEFVVFDEELSTADIDKIRGGTYGAGVGGTNAQINIGDTWKTIAGMQINIGDDWKAVEGAQINIGDTWKTIF